LPVFAEKGRPFIYLNPVNEPARAALPLHCLIRQSTAHKPVMYTSNRVNQTAYTRINAPHDGEPVLDGPKNANSRMLRQFRAR
jgi:hypothetical protein